MGVTLLQHSISRIDVKCIKKLSEPSSESSSKSFLPKNEFLIDGKSFNSCRCLSFKKANFEILTF